MLALEQLQFKSICPVFSYSLVTINHPAAKPL